MSTLCTFVHGTNAVYIEMRSRVSGDFRMSITLTSPQAGLELASGQLTVRSMSTSAVAIALTVAAGAVLLVWWGRTVWRNRRTRRGAHRRVAVTDRERRERPGPVDQNASAPRDHGTGDADRDRRPR